MIRATLLALALLLAVASPVNADPLLDPKDTLSRSLELLLEAKRQPVGQHPQRVAQILQLLRADESLKDSDWLATPLTQSPPDLDQAEKRLRSAIAVLGTPAPAQGSDLQAQQRQALRDILNNPPFQTIDWSFLVPEWAQPLLIALAALGEQFVRVLVVLGNKVFGVVAGFLRGPLVVVLGLVIVAALIVLYRAAFRSSIVGQVELSEEEQLARLTAAGALLQAEAMAEQRRYREACHYALLSTLLWFDEQGLAHFNPSLTNREYLRQFRAQPELVAQLTPLVSRFDQIWYGQGSPTEADYRNLLALAPARKAAV